MIESTTPTPEEVATEHRFLTALEDAFTQPLTPEAIDPQFIETALNLAKIPQPERLAKTKMRTNGPKYLTVKQALGADRFNAYGKWAKTLSSGLPQLKYPGKDGRRSGFRHRGLMQFAAALVACSLGQITAEEFCQSINSRVGKTLFYRKPPSEASSQYGTFTNLTASVPEGSLVKAWQFLISQHETTQN